MADRYWVSPINDAWDATAGLKWSTTDGGVGGAAEPTASDNVFFTASFATQCTVSGARVCNNLDFTGYAGTFTGSGGLTISGSLTLGAAMTRTYTGAITFDSTATGKTIASNAITLASAITFNGVGGAWTLADAFVTTGSVTLTNGAFVDGGFAVTANAFLSNNTNTRTLTKTGNWIITGTGACFNCNSTPGLTLTDSGTLTFTDNSASARTLSFGVAASGPEWGNVVVNAGTGTLTLNSSGSSVNSVTLTGYAGAQQNGGIRYRGSYTYGAGQTDAATAALSYVGTSGTGTLTTNGVSLSRNVTCAGVGGTLALGGALTTSLAIIVTEGTFTTNNHNTQSSTFQMTGSNTKVANLGSSTLTLTNTGSITSIATTGTTLNAGTSTFKATDTSSASVTFAGNGFTFANLWFARGTSTGTNTITGANTFADIKDDGSVAHTLTLPAGVTTTTGTFTVSGNAGQLITLASSTPGTQATLAKTGGGTVSRNYLAISDSAATPANTWYAGANSENDGNNSGWTFQDETSALLGFFFMP